ncbi:MAG: aminotransferase class V-fold PLP-dependent enzyme [Oscillospiraceae bacterium]
MKNEFPLLREDFPILNEPIHGHPLVYLDNAATTQMPRAVARAMGEQLFTANGNVHRGLHTLSLRATSALERARETVRTFLGAETAEEIVFTSGTTASVNRIADAFAAGELGPGDRVIATEMEHHSNFVPWQQACLRSGAEFVTAPVLGNGELDLPRLTALLDGGARLLALTWVSNVTGTVNPVRELIRLAHEKGVPVFLDAAQAMRHFRVDVRELDCDFLAFSGHKLMGPTGIGVLYGKIDWLERLPAVTFGGGMVEHVSPESSRFDKPPLKFEAGTPNYIGAVGLAAAMDYLNGIGLDRIAARERSLIETCEELLRAIPQVHILGSPGERAGALSFVMDGTHPADAALLLDSLGFAVRSGHLCAQPLLRRFGLDAVVRVSPAFYNTPEELEALARALERIITLGKRA